MKGCLRYIVLFLIIFQAGLAYTQTLQIKAQIINSKTKEPVSYTNIVILNDKDSIVDGVLSDEKGYFGILVGKKYPFTLSIQIMGYKTRSLNVKNESELKQFSAKDTFEITPATGTLNEVSVVDYKDYVLNKFDRKVYNVDKKEVVAAKSILDILRLLPGVNVDEDGNVFYKGADASIFVDDQPSGYIYAKIEQIPVDRVKNIELIDNAVYSGGTGRGGIINIKLKEIKEDGLSGLLSANSYFSDYNDVNRSELNVNLNFKYKKLILFDNFSYDLNNKNQTVNTYKLMNEFDPLMTHVYNYNSETSSHSYHNYTGLIYNPSNRTKFYIGYSDFCYNYELQSNKIFQEKELKTEIISNNYNNTAYSNSDQPQRGINYSYRHSFDTLDSYLNISGTFVFNNFNLYSTDQEHHTIHDYYSTDSVYQYSSLSENQYKTLSLSVRYNKSISENTRWFVSYSGKYAIAEKSNYEFYEFYDTLPINGKFFNDDKQTHDFNLRYGTKINKWKFDFGVNMEITLHDGYFKIFNEEVSDTTLTVNKLYIKPQPSASIYYSINKEHELKITLSNTSRAPYFYSLCDYIYHYSAYSWSSGNSQLKPVDYYSLYFNYSLTKKNFNCSTDLFVSVSDNETDRVVFPVTSMIMLSKYENVALKKTLGVDYSAWTRVNKNLNMSLNLSLYLIDFNRKKLSPDSIYYIYNQSDSKKRDFGYYVKYNLSYQLGKYRSMLYIYYTGKTITYNGFNYAKLNSSFDIRRSFLKDRLNLSIGIKNIFGNLVQYGQETEDNNVYTKILYYGTNYNRQLFVNLKYNFRKGDRGTKYINL